MNFLSNAKTWDMMSNWKDHILFRDINGRLKNESLISVKARRGNVFCLLLCKMFQNCCWPIKLTKRQSRMRLFLSMTSWYGVSPSACDSDWLPASPYKPPQLLKARTRFGVWSLSNQEALCLLRLHAPCTLITHPNSCCDLSDWAARL